MPTASVDTAARAGATLAAAFARAVGRDPLLVAEAAASLDRSVHDEDGLADLLHRASEVAVRWLPEVDHAGITIQLDGTPFTAAGTDAVVLAVDALQYEVDDGPCLVALRTGAIVSVDAAQALARWPEFAARARKHGIASFLATPLLVDGVGRGSMNLYSCGTEGFREPQADLVAVLSAYVSRSLSDYAALRTARTQAVHMRAAMAGRAPIEQAKGILMAVHQISADEAFERLRAQSQRSNTKLRDLAASFISASITLPDAGPDASATTAPGEPADFQSAFDHAPLGVALADPAGVLGTVNPALAHLLGRSPEQLAGVPLLGAVHPDDTDTARVALARFREGGERTTTLGTRLRDRHGGWVPVTLSVAKVYAGDGSLAHLVLHVEDLSTHRALAEELRQQALHDPLTGLPNRLLFLERLQHGARRHARTGRPLSLLFCDVDEFKVVNDTHGHQAGDTVLVALAQRLQAGLRPGDTAARVGGDEFAVLCEDTDDDAAAVVAARLATALAAPTDVQGHDVVVTVSIGAATSATGDAPDPVALWKAADLAMYAAKSRRRG